MFLFFHVNPIGMPKKWNVPASDTFFWPRLMSIAWQQYDKFGAIQKSEDFIIKPDGFEIPIEAEDRYKITPDQAREEGVELEEVLKKFSALVDESKYLIAHNMKLSASVVEAEFIRKNMSSRISASEQFSLMQEATYFCKIPARGGTKYKWPTIQELYQRCYGSKFADGHDAKVAVQAVANCFFYLVKKEEIDLF